MYITEIFYSFKNEYIIILQNNSKKISYCILILLYSDLFSIMLASENYNNIHVLDTQPITDIISKVTTLNIDERNFINQKDNLKLLLQDFFTELKNISYNISNKENLWFLFDSVPHISRILTPLIYFYYQRDRELTDFFIDNTNGLFDSIEDDQSKLNAKQCAFLLIQKKIQAAEKMWVVRDMKTEKVFFIYQKTTYIS